jgi:hypothetical protein
MPFFDVVNETPTVDRDVLLSFLNVNPSVAETMRRDMALISTGLYTPGNVEITYFSPIVDLTVTQIMMMTNGPQVGSGLTNARMGLYTVDGDALTLAARTSLDSTLFKSAYTRWTRSFSSTGGFPTSVNLVAGQRYAIGVFATGTAGTMPALYISGFGLSRLYEQSPRMASIITGQSDLPTTFTHASGNAINRMHYGALS